MLRFAKTVGCVSLLVFGLESAFGFSLMGPPNQAWQVPEIAYNLPGDIGAPHNLGEEYRWNTPTIYYAFDQSFLDYFASNGVVAVDQAIGILNGLTNFSRYSASLDEVPLETRRFNYTAQALHLMDLKTATLSMMLEELGLTDSERYVWTLRTRDTQPGLTCPYMYYGVIKLSFDPTTWEPSSYINNTLYSYIIIEICTGGPPVAWTFPFTVDPLAVEHLPATSPFYSGLGLYMTGLTKDDVGGLRYIYQPTNVNWESMSSDSMMLYTNVPGGPQLLMTSNLTLLSSQALTNSQAALQALYPALNIVATTNIYTNIWVTNVTVYFTNNPTDPYGMPPRLAYLTNRTLTVQTWYRHTFGNLVTFEFVNGAWTMVPLSDITTHIVKVPITVETTYQTNYPSDPYGMPPRIYTTTVTYRTNVVAGEYYILTNLCGISISGLQATIVSSTTNVVNSFTNMPLGATNFQFYYQAVIEYFTNHVFTYYPVDCVVTNVTLLQGIDKFTFVKTSYDSLVGRFYQPITNLYKLVTVTNSHLVTNWYQRVVNKPDFLFSAADLTGVGSAVRTVTSQNFNDSNANPGLAGPGNIEPNMQIAFNKIGPMLINFYGTNFILSGMSESTAITNYIWGSFDGSTNAPVVYPSGLSIMNLEAQILYQIITPALSDGRVGRSYPATQLQVAGGTASYSWSWSGGVPSLPPGLSLSGGGVISGTPTAAGTWIFNVTVSGADARRTTRTMQVIIAP